MYRIISTRQVHGWHQKGVQKHSIIKIIGIHPEKIHGEEDNHCGDKQRKTNGVDIFVHIESNNFYNFKV